MSDMNNFEFMAKVKAWHAANPQPPEYPGATRILGGTKDQTGLLEWRMRVGDAEADRILKESLEIGTSLDKIVDDHYSLAGFSADNYTGEIGFPLYRSMLPQLRRVVSAGTQVCVWSDRLKVKGFIDICGLFDSTPSIIDIKNSRKPKRADWIEDYFLQTTTYALAAHDCIGVDIKQVVLIIGVRPGETHTQETQVFVEPVRKYAAAALRRIKEYHSTHNYLEEKRKELA